MKCYFIPELQWKLKKDKNCQFWWTQFFELMKKPNAKVDPSDMIVKQRNL